jgi:hypothetical protein
MDTLLVKGNPDCRTESCQRAIATRIKSNLIADASSSVAGCTLLGGVKSSGQCRCTGRIARRGATAIWATGPAGEAGVLDRLSAGRGRPLARGKRVGAGSRSRGGFAHLWAACADSVPIRFLPTGWLAVVGVAPRRLEHLAASRATTLHRQHLATPLTANSGVSVEHR